MYISNILDVKYYISVSAELYAFLFLSFGRASDFGCFRKYLMCYCAFGYILLIARALKDAAVMLRNMLSISR